MATRSGILAWRIPWTEEPGELYSSWGRKESDRTEVTERAQAPCYPSASKRILTMDWILNKL